MRLSRREVHASRARPSSIWPVSRDVRRRLPFHRRKETPSPLASLPSSPRPPHPPSAPPPPGRTVCLFWTFRARETKHTGLQAWLPSLPGSRVHPSHGPALPCG